MNKEKLQSLFNNFLAKIEKIENQKTKYQNWYDYDWKLMLANDIKSECAELEYDLANTIINSVVYGEK